MAIIEKISCESFELRHSIDKEPNDSEFKPHIHENYELYCLVKGDVDYIVEGHLYNLRPGAILLMRPSETHKLIVKSKQEYERYVLNFRHDFILENGFSKDILSPYLSRELGEKNLYLPSEFEHITPLSYLEKIFKEARQLNYADVVLSNLVSLLSSISVAFCNKEIVDTDSDIGNKIISFVNRNLTDDISTEAIASYVHLSPSQVSRIFKKLMGTSIHNYIISKRLILFHEKLSMGKSALNASQECGFHDYSSFYRIYKKRFGKPPTKSRTE